ncbi:hypothetical protein B0T17DRAFT_616125 [Bombardia bombarda]|uniref:Uncharacterized protein n=1 Tax=Bombardia bombarda TaxID=252184 RepID=A0AA39XB45_9PEZI|nr:hypothetical protein B0T17DRAFT_616125 [Bombardia bombarda]
MRWDADSPHGTTATSRVSLLAFFALFLTNVAVLTNAQDDAHWQSNFSFPTDGQIFHTMDTVLVTYTSPFPSPRLYVWCGPGGPSQEFSEDAPPFNASFPVLLNFTSAKPCWFNLRRIGYEEVTSATNATEAAEGVNGFEFNVLGSVRDGGPQTIVASSFTSTSTTSSSLSSPTSISTTTSDSSTPSSAPAGSGGNSIAAGSTGSGGLSAGAAAGIGVGVAIAVIALAAGAVVWLRRWKKKVRESPSIMHPDGGGGDGLRYEAPGDNGAYGNQAVQSHEQKWPLQQHAPYEMSEALMSAAEMPTATTRHEMMA